MYKLIATLMLSWLLPAGQHFVFAQSGFINFPMQSNSRMPDVFLASEKPAKPYVKWMVLEEKGNAWTDFNTLLDSMQKRAAKMGVDALWILNYQPQLIAQANGFSSMQVLQAVALKYAHNLEFLSQFPQRLLLQRSGHAADTIPINWDFRISTYPAASTDARWLMTDVLPWIPPLMLAGAQPGYSYKWNAGRSRLRIKDADNDTRHIDYEWDGNALTKIDGTEVLPEKRTKWQLDIKAKGERMVETRLHSSNNTLWHHYYNYDSQNRLSSIEQWTINGSSRTKIFELFIEYRSPGDVPKAAIIHP